MRQVIHSSPDPDRPALREIATDAVSSYAGDGHDHWHVREVVRYSLIGEGETRRDEKVGFCLLDSERLAVTTPAYYEAAWCGEERDALDNRMGISAGWGDVYRRDLEWQWIDITGLPPGSYTLSATVDPDGFYLEADEDNQCTSVVLSLTEELEVTIQERDDRACPDDS